MGIGELINEKLKGMGRRRLPGGGKEEKCPKCKATVTLDMERCPKCGTRISSMFRIECPKCKTANELDAKRCSKCGYEFEAEPQKNKTVYKCPLCGYEADYWMTQCPSCGVKFV